METSNKAIKMDEVLREPNLGEAKNYDKQNGDTWVQDIEVHVAVEERA